MDDLLAVHLAREAAHRQGMLAALLGIAAAFNEREGHVYTAQQVSEFVKGMYRDALAEPARSASVRPSWIPVDNDDRLDNRIRDAELGREEADDGGE